MPKFCDMLRFLREKKGLTQLELSKLLGISKSSVNMYERGEREPGLEMLELIADTFNVDLDYLMGKSDCPNRSSVILAYDSLPSNIIPVPEMRKIPLIGSISCGAPILADEHIDGYVGVPNHIRADFALLCKGDSMVNAGILDNDVVYIRKQEVVENGQIAAVVIDGMETEATLKRFYFEDGVVTLSPENAKYAPKTFVGSDIERVRIVGLAVGYTHSFEWA